MRLEYKDQFKEYRVDREQYRQQVWFFQVDVSDDFGRNKVTAEIGFVTYTNFDVDLPDDVDQINTSAKKFRHIEYWGTFEDAQIQMGEYLRTVAMNFDWDAMTKKEMQK